MFRPVWQWHVPIKGAKPEFCVFSFIFNRLPVFIPVFGKCLIVGLFGIRRAVTANGPKIADKQRIVQEQ